MQKNPKDDTERKLLATLRRHVPFRVRAYNGDDDARDIAVPQNRRKRWGQVIEAIEAKPWTRIELLDKSGAALGYCDNEGPARDVEDIGPSFAGLGGQLLLAERISALVVKAQREAMSFRDAEVTALLKAQGDVVREMAAGVTALASVYREQTVAAEDAAEARAAAQLAANGGSQLKELMEALPVLMQALPLLRNMLTAGPPATSNGVRPKSA
jgi:hypothetical protein